MRLSASDSFLVRTSANTAARVTSRTEGPPRDEHGGDEQRASRPNVTSRRNSATPSANQQPRPAVRGSRPRWRRASRAAPCTAAESGGHGWPAHPRLNPDRSALRGAASPSPTSGLHVPPGAAHCVNSHSWRSRSPRARTRCLPPLRSSSLIGSQGHDRVTEGPAARLRNVPYRASNTFGRVHGL
jgi:hypothetical protein